MSDFAKLVGAEGPVTVVGGRTRWHVGGKVHPDAREVHAPSGVMSYDPAEMTVTVRAGTTTTELTAALTEAGQRCALPERGGTVGGSSLSVRTTPKY